MGFRNLSTLTAAGTALSNTTTETALAGALFSIPANTLRSGVSYHIRALVRATSTNSTDTLQVRARGHTASTLAGGTAAAASGAVDATDNDIVFADLRLTPRSAAGSTAGTVAVDGIMTTVGAEGTTTSRGVFEILTVDYTAAYYFGLTGAWSAASASDSAQVETFAVDEVS